ncbi:von Willebrand factor A domain-containing protein 2-like [Aplochiton taeniatus]
MLAHAAVLLMLLVGLGQSFQDIQADKDLVVKIAASGKLIQCSAAIDLLLLLDGSYSVGKGSFERSKHFAAKLLDALDINPDRVRVGAIQFSSKPRVEFGLSDYPTREEAHQAIKNIYFRGGSTEAGRAVHYVLKKGFPGGRTKVPRILLLLTDGRSQDNLKGAAHLAKKSGIKLFAVGVRHPDWDVLHVVASEPTELYVFSAELYQDSINGLLTTLTQTAVCSDVHPLCRVESRVCFRTTVQSLREPHGNHMCWKRKGQSYHARPMAGTCPYYSWRRASKTIQSRCYRTICPDPCESSPCMNGGTCITESVEEHSCLCPLGYRADTNCVPAGLLDCSVDLVFLIDGSWKSGLEDFNLAKDFIRRFVLSLSSSSFSSSSSPEIHLAVAQYADEVVLEVPPGRHGNAADFLEALEEVPFRGGATLTGAALGNMAENECWFPAERERGFRNNVPHVMVLISGAKSKDPVSLGVERVQQRELFLLAVGPTRMQGELTRVTSDPDVVFTYDNAQGVRRKIEELKSRICAITAPDYLQVKAFVKSVVACFDLDLTQVAMWPRP